MSKEKFTVFFSWQSDIKSNRKIIQDSIAAACQIQKEKYGYEVEMDESTWNLPGSPSIEDAVLRKIAEADIVVCDITPIGVIGQKQMPNSNVVFELGFAMHALGQERIILMAKKGNWDLKDLPFDFNHRRIGTFSSAKDCNLNYEIGSCINHCRKNRLITIEWQKVFRRLKGVTGWLSLKHLQSKGGKVDCQIKATEYSTVFFARRMAAAFPGVRGVVEFTNRRKIINCLSVLLQSPLNFEHGLERADIDPVWFLRDGATENISTFKRIGHKKVLMNIDELLIKRIVVFRNSARYYAEYVYVEVEADQPCGCYSYSQDMVNDCVNTIGYCQEEFAVFKPSWYLPAKKITRQEYDDNATVIYGRHQHLNGKAQLRARYLAPYNFILAAKGSPYNCPEFDRSSKDYFKGMLDGTVTNEQFSNYMMQFKRR
ncbi:MAG: nucleotide-binding protein [Prevotella sp.]|nr:nucleotide-binding protein [Prevotella sp.]